MNTSDFVILPDNTKEQTWNGHGTVVKPRSTLTGDFVQKQVSPQGVFKDNHDIWLSKVKNARLIADEIRAFNNPAYYVPKTYISNGKVYEEKAAGVMLAHLPQGYLSENKDWLIPAAANFINDMSELRPVKIDKKATHRYAFPGLWFPNRKDMEELPKRFPFISESDWNLIWSVHRYLISLPEAQELVFSHNDLNGGNVFVDDEHKRVTFIDFEMAGYVSKMALMYLGGVHKVPELWDYINNRLERKINKDLTWNYNKDIDQLYRLICFVSIGIRRNITENIKKIPERCAEIRKFIQDKKIKFKIAAYGMKPHTASSVRSIVPISHYQKD